MNEPLLEPLKFYENIGKQLHADSTTEYFNDLLTRSGVSVDANRATVKAYDAEQKKIDAVKRKIFWYKFLRIASIVVIIIGAILGIYGIAVGNWIMAGISLPVAVALLIVILKALNPIIKKSNEQKEAYQKKANALFEEAMAQMAPLNSLFSSRDTFNLIEKTLPVIKFDNRFSRKKEFTFVENYGFIPTGSEDTSALRVVSGDLFKNPFVFCRRIKHRMGVETYHGTLLISWTEVERDSEGHMHTVRRTQTLHASVTKPKPFYSTDTALFFGSHAAPDLSFSRTPKHSEDLSERQVEKKVKRGKKKLEKKARKALKKGGSFQEMSNAEFEVLFGADDRNNETQFRLMFTPLAQVNTVDLLRSETGFGDDFSFVKSNKLNIIRSEHMQGWRMNTSPTNYYSHSVDIARTKFESFNNAYFKSVFFDLAPLLSIPVYSEEPPTFLADDSALDCNFATFEHESMANSLKDANFAHPDSATQAILKTSLVSSDSEGDTVAVTAFSYSAHSRLDLIPVLGGDGNIHPVPVHWTEYIPVYATSTIKVSLEKDQKEKESDDENALFNGLFANIL